MHIIKLLNNSIRKIPTWLVYIILSIPALYYTMALLSNQLGPDPYFNFVTGITIRVPPLSTIQSALGI